MTINIKQDGSALKIALVGRLDTMTAPELEEELRNSLEGVKELTFDFSELEYISSAGLRALLTAFKALYGKGTVKVVNANEIVREVFEVTGFSAIVPVE